MSAHPPSHTGPAEIVHHVGKAAVLLIRHSTQQFQNVILRIMQLSRPDDFLPACREIEIGQVLGDAQRGLDREVVRHAKVLQRDGP
jgi:hypothetical protein